ncbi:MAG: ROK family protein [Ignavibacteria bacterium]|jgi:glucokinase
MRLGIDFGGTNLKIGLYDEDANVLAFDEARLKEVFEETGVEKGLLITLKKYFDGYEITKAGLAIKGLVDRKSGRLFNDIGIANVFAGTNMKTLLEKEFGVPFTIENDARAYTYGEYKFGAGKGYESIVVMTLGTGLGCSAVINKELYYSSDPLSGVLGGHISIDRNGPECPCGSRGCLESYCSATAFAKQVKANHPELEKEKDVLPVFFNNALHNKPYQKTLAEFNENLALGIVNLIHAYGPEAVILGGGVMNSSKQIIPAVQKIVDKRAWTYPKGKVKVLLSELGNKAASIGAAFL